MRKLLLFFLLLPLTEISAQQKSGTLSVTVVGAGNHKLIDYGHVEVRTRDNNGRMYNQAWMQISGSTNPAIVKNLSSAKEYEVEGSSPMYNKQTIPHVHIYPGQTTRITITLHPQARNGAVPPPPPPPPPGMIIKREMMKKER